MLHSSLPPDLHPRESSFHTEQYIPCLNCLSRPSQFLIPFFFASHPGLHAAMALVSAYTIIRALALFHVTLAVFMLRNPRMVAEQNIVFVLGEAMQLVCSIDTCVVIMDLWTDFTSRRPANSSNPRQPQPSSQCCLPSSVYPTSLPCPCRRRLPKHTGAHKHLSGLPSFLALRDTRTPSSREASSGAAVAVRAII